MRSAAAKCSCLYAVRDSCVLVLTSHPPQQRARQRRRPGEMQSPRPSCRCARAMGSRRRPAPAPRARRRRGSLARQDPHPRQSRRRCRCRCRCRRGQGRWRERSGRPRPWREGRRWAVRAARGCQSSLALASASPPVQAPSAHPAGRGHLARAPLRARLVSRGARMRTAAPAGRARWRPCTRGPPKSAAQAHQAHTCPARGL